MKTTIYTKPVKVLDDLLTKTSESIKITEKNEQITNISKYQGGKYVTVPIKGGKENKKFPIKLSKIGQGWVSLTSDKKEYSAGEIFFITARFNPRMELDGFDGGDEKGNIIELTIESETMAPGGGIEVVLSGVSRAENMCVAVSLKSKVERIRLKANVDNPFIERIQCRGSMVVNSVFGGLPYQQTYTNFGVYAGNRLKIKCDKDEYIDIETGIDATLFGLFEIGYDDNFSHMQFSELLIDNTHIETIRLAKSNFDIPHPIITNNIALKTIECWDSSYIKELELSSNPALTTLSFSQINLTKLDVLGCTQLTTLSADPDDGIIWAVKDLSIYVDSPNICNDVVALINKQTGGTLTVQQEIGDIYLDSLGDATDVQGWTFNLTEV